MTPSPGRELKSLHRTLDLLDALAASNPGISLARLASQLNLPRSTVHRHLATLVARGYASQDARTGHYRLGVRAFTVGHTAPCYLRLREAAQPVMQQVAARVRCPVNLAIRDGAEAVYIDHIGHASSPQLFTRLGARVPSHCTGVGKVLLGALTDAQLRHTLHQTDLRRYTVRTLVRIEEVLAAVREADRNGYALDLEERAPDVRCVAVAVHDEDGQIVGALSVSGTAAHFRDPELTALVTLLKRAGRQVSAALGHRSQPSAL